DAKRPCEQIRPASVLSEHGPSPWLQRLGGQGIRGLEAWRHDVSAPWIRPLNHAATRSVDRQRAAIWATARTSAERFGPAGYMARRVGPSADQVKHSGMPQAYPARRARHVAQDLLSRSEQRVSTGSSRISTMDNHPRPDNVLDNPRAPFARGARLAAGPDARHLGLRFRSRPNS